MILRFLLFFLISTPLFALMDEEEKRNSAIPIVPLPYIEYEALYLPHAFEALARHKGLITRRELRIFVEAVLENTGFDPDNNVALSDESLCAFYVEPPRIQIYNFTSGDARTYNLNQKLPKGLPSDIWQLSRDNRVFFVWAGVDSSSLYKFDIESRKLHHLYKTQKEFNKLIIPALYEEDFCRSDAENWTIPIGEVFDSDDDDSESSDDEEPTLPQNQPKPDYFSRLFRIPFSATQPIEKPVIDYISSDSIFCFFTNKQGMPIVTYSLVNESIEIHRVIGRTRRVLLRAFRSSEANMDTSNMLPQPTFIRSFTRALDCTRSDKPTPCLFDMQNSMNTIPLMTEQEIESHDFEISSWILNPTEPRDLITYSLKDAQGTWIGRNPLGNKIAVLLNHAQGTHNLVLKEKHTSSDGRSLLLSGRSAFGERKYGILLIKDEPQFTWVELTPPASILKHIAPRIVKSFPFIFKARDGLNIEAIITHPPHHLPYNPSILNIHGGPNSRQKIDFDDEISFLASRGFTVLEVNFRGSSGRGINFSLLGVNSWGGPMVEDLVDAVDFAHTKGWFNKEHMAAMGASYGAHAAISLALKLPHLVKCIFTFSGVYDLLSNSAADLVVLHQIDPTSVDERYLLCESSPLEHAAQLQCPSLLVHGVLDVNTPFKQAHHMYNELRKYGKPSAFAKLNFSGHCQPDDLNDYETYLGLLENFLGQQLGTFYVPIRSNEINSERIKIHDPRGLIGYKLSNWNGEE